MKTRVLSITFVFCCLHTICACGTSQKNYSVLKCTNDTIEIAVSGDCDIVVADIAPSEIKIYGDNGCGGSNENYFEANQVRPNKKENGIKIVRENSRVVLRVTYNALKKAEVKIVSAIYKDSVRAKPDKAGYFPGDPFIILVGNDRQEGNNADSIAEYNGSSIPEGQYVCGGEKLISEDGVEEGCEQMQKDSDKGAYDILSLLIALLIGLLIGCFLFKHNRKALKELSKECSDLKKLVDNLGNNSAQVISHHSTRQKSKENTPMMDDDIKRFIVDQIKKMQTQYSSSVLQPTIVTSSNVDPVANHFKKEEQAIDTDNVKYHQDDNTFTLEQTEIKIFRIYSKKGEFYYTIVSDSAVREELIGMLQMFEGCLTYQTTDSIAKRVEPVTDGKLIKDGNKFNIDANNKLVVKFA